MKRNKRWIRCKRKMWNKQIKKNKIKRNRNRIPKNKNNKNKNLMRVI